MRIHNYKPIEAKKELSEKSLEAKTTPKMKPATKPIKELATKRLILRKVLRAYMAT